MGHGIDWCRLCANSIHQGLKGPVNIAIPLDQGVQLTAFWSQPVWFIRIGEKRNGWLSADQNQMLGARQHVCRLLAKIR